MSKPFIFDESTFPTYLTDKRMKKGLRKEAPKNLRSINHEILRLTLLGWKGTEIAAHLGCSPVTVSNTLASPKGRTVLMMMQQARAERTIDIAEDMRAFAPRALEVWKECIDDPENKVPLPVRSREAREFLGVCGFVKPQRIQSQSITTHLTLEEIEQLKAQARQRAQASGVMSPSTDEILEEVNFPLIQEDSTGLVIDMAAVNKDRSLVEAVESSLKVGESQRRQSVTVENDNDFDEEQD
jgi:hypothetical protein